MVVDLPKQLFHLTDVEKLESIMKNGIIPGNGENCLLAQDLRKGKLFLCNEDDIPYWSILLNKDKVIEVNTECLVNTDIEHCDYGCYGEYFTSYQIGVESIKRKPMIILKTDAMIDLCKDYMLCVSDLIVHMTRVATNPNLYVNEYIFIKEDVSSVISIMESRLDYSYVDKQYLSRVISDLGEDGEYTMCDMYCVTERCGTYQLWQQLVHYDFSNKFLSGLKDSYFKMSEFVQNKFPWVSDISTGGYTG